MFYVRLEHDSPHGDDLDRLELGFSLLDATIRVLEEGGTLKEAASEILTVEVQARLAIGKREYMEDLARAVTFQVRLPVWQLPRGDAPAKDEPLDPPESGADHWSLCDGIHITNPTSPFFVAMARGDHQRSRLGMGYSLIVISRDREVKELKRPRIQHTISTDPFSGLHLTGLGKMLEVQEQRKENLLGDPLPELRKRLKKGEGRHGYDVPSPWYDGRAHQYTIVDSPVVRDGKEDLCGSLLSEDEVLETLWRYGNPLNHLRVLEAEITLFAQVVPEEGLGEEWGRLDELRRSEQTLTSSGRSSGVPDPFAQSINRQNQPERGIKSVSTDLKWKTAPGTMPSQPLLQEASSSSSKDFNSEILDYFSPDNEEVDIQIHGLKGEKATLPPGFLWIDQQVWREGESAYLWVGRFRVKPGHFSSLGDLGRALHHLRWDEEFPRRLVGLPCSGNAFAYHLVSVRVPAEDISLSEENRALLQGMHSLATADNGDFSQLANDEELQMLQRVRTLDRHLSSYMLHEGTASISIRRDPFVDHSGFQRPDRISNLVAFCHLHKVSLDVLEAGFAKHRTEANTYRASKRILKDRWRLLFIRQFYDVSSVSRNEHGQKLYQTLRGVLRLPSSMETVSRKVEELTKQIQESRAEFYQHIAFWVSFVFAPLAVTASIFSGTHLLRSFGDDYLLLLPSLGVIDGWLHFAAVLLLVLTGSLLLWSLLRTKQVDVISMTRRSVNRHPRRKQQNRVRWFKRVFMLKRKGKGVGRA